MTADGVAQPPDPAPPPLTALSSPRQPVPAPPQPAVPASDVPGDWQGPSDRNPLRPRSAMEVLSGLSEKVSRGAVTEYQPIPLGMTPLDRTLGGGIRAGELMMIGGAQGTGKTTMALQIARNIAQSGQANVLYICFEHDEEYLLGRMVAMETALAGTMPPSANSAVKIQDVRREVLGTWMAQGGDASADLRANPRLRPALERIGRYGQGLFLLRGSQTSTTPENLRSLVEGYRRSAPAAARGVHRLPPAVPIVPDPATETEKVTIVVAALKDLALSLGVAVVAIVAADKEGLKAARLRNHHLRGSSAINYEADAILILNEKYQIVAKVNIEFNPYQAQRFRDWTILTVEKNRSGRDAVDLEFEKHFEFSCFDPNGRQVQEKLIEERLYND
jgi:replicative DNA helicase